MQVVFFGFFNLLIMVRIIDPGRIGTWILFTSVVSFLELIRSGFIRNPFLVVYLNAEPSEKPKVLLASVVLHVVTTLVTGLLLIVAAGFLSRFWSAEELRSLFYLYALNSIILIPFFHFEFILQSRIDYKAIFLSNLIRLGLVTPFLVVFFAIGFTPTLLQLVWIQLGSIILATILSFQFIRVLGLSLAPYDFKRKNITDLLNLGKYTIGTVISSSFFRSTDSWMIGKLMSSYWVAQYNPAIRLANLVDVPTVAIVTLVFPRVSTQMKERGPDGIREIYCKSVGLILAIILPVCAFVYAFAGPIVEIIFGKQYLDAVPVLQVTVFYMLMLPFIQQFGAVMDAIKRPKVNFYFLLGAAAINLVFNYLMILEFGIIGAAYGTILTYVLLLAFSQAFLYRFYRISPLKVFAFTLSWYRLGILEAKKIIAK